MSLRVLVLGGSGWLGETVVPRIAAVAPTEAPPRAAADLDDETSLRRVFDAVRPGVVLNLAAVNPGRGAADLMERINVSGAGRVAELARAAGARLVHMSTDVVFDGLSPPYREDSEPRAVTPYGRTKAAGEAAVRAAHEDALIVRTSLVFDPGAPERFTRTMMERLARGEPVDLFTDEIRCPVARPTIAAALAEIVLRDDLQGTLHVAGTQALSRHDFGVRLLRRFGAPRLDLVRRAAASAFLEPRALDLTLDLSRARSLLATPLRGVDEELSLA